MLAFILYTMRPVMSSIFCFLFQLIFLRVKDRTTAAYHEKGCILEHFIEYYRTICLILFVFSKLLVIF